MRRALLALMIALLVASLAGAAFGARYAIKARANDTWDPDYRHISKGDVVVWKNPDDRFHDLNAYGGNWRMRQGLGPGESTSKRFKARGVFKFRCRIHSYMTDGQCDGMCGVVHVGR